MPRQLPIFSGRRVKPRINPSNVVGRDFGKRNVVAVVRWAASRNFKVQIRYMRLQDGIVKNYRVEPYSFRYRKTRDGVRKMLFAHHGVHRRIHGFVLSNILSIKVLNEKYRPRWKVEL